MDQSTARGSLVWVTRAYALNPLAIQLVFHGKHGEVEVHVAGSLHKFAEADLTADGRALLLPPAGVAPEPRPAR